MSTKFDLHIFPNGRVYFISCKDYEEAFEQEKEILIICNAWSGGYAIKVGGEPEYNDGRKIGYYLYTTTLKNIEITSDTYSQYYKVIITPGEMIRMESKEQANSYFNGQFVDYYSKDEEIQSKFYDPLNKDELNKLRRTVDSKATVRFLPKDEDLKEKVQILINYGIISKNSMDFII